MNINFTFIKNLFYLVLLLVLLHLTPHFKAVIIASNTFFTEIFVEVSAFRRDYFPYFSIIRFTELLGKSTLLNDNIFIKLFFSFFSFELMKDCVDVRFLMGYFDTFDNAKLS